MRSVFAKVCGWLAASFAVAAAAHALIGLLGTSYAERAHVAIVPLALVLVAIAAASLGFVVVRTLDEGDGRTGVRVARHIASLQTPTAVGAVTCGALATLLCVETAEQLASLGHVAGIADALGGNPALGIALVFAVACALVASVRHCLEAIVRAACVSTLGAASWIEATFRARSDASKSAAWQSRARSRRAYVHFGLRAATAHGLRAPPLAI